MSNELYFARQASVNAAKRYKELLKQTLDDALASYGLKDKKVYITRRHWLGLAERRNTLARHKGVVYTSPKPQYIGYLTATTDGGTASCPAIIMFKSCETVKSSFGRDVPVYEATMNSRINNDDDLKDIRAFVRDTIMPYFKPLE